VSPENAEFDGLIRVGKSLNLVVDRTEVPHKIWCIFCTASCKPWAEYVPANLQMIRASAMYNCVYTTPTIQNITKRQTHLCSRSYKVDRARLELQKHGLLPNVNLLAAHTHGTLGVMTVQVSNCNMISATTTQKKNEHCSGCLM
jgi:hypothetical protein